MKIKLEIGMKYRVLFRDEDGEVIKYVEANQTFRQVIMDIVRSEGLNVLDIKFVLFVPEERVYARGFAINVDIINLY